MGVFAEVLEVALGHDLEFFLLQLALGLRAFIFFGFNRIATADNVKLDGTVDRKKYSYNTALMIRANALLYALTSEPRYLAEARRVARSAEERWVDPATGGIADGGPFAHMLLESFLAVHQQDPDPRWPRVVNRALAFVHDQVRDPAGHYASRWNRPQTAALREFMLLDQASAARAYWVAARALGDGTPGASDPESRMH